MMGCSLWLIFLQPGRVKISSDKIKYRLRFYKREKPEFPREKLSEQNREPINYTITWCGKCESIKPHIGLWTVSVFTTRLNLFTYVGSRRVQQATETVD